GSVSPTSSRCRCSPTGGRPPVGPSTRRPRPPPTASCCAVTCSHPAGRRSPATTTRSTPTRSPAAARPPERGRGSRPGRLTAAASPDGVVLRRHLQTRGRQVISVEDDLLDADAVSGDVALAGEGALMSALHAHRTGRMGDIVATIQAEQDAAIRSPADGVLVVQGGPGTGKTAVALHRAAYLLRSEEHTSELQSRENLVCRLLLEK